MINNDNNTLTSIFSENRFTRVSLPLAHKLSFQAAALATELISLQDYYFNHEKKSITVKGFTGFYRTYDELALVVGMPTGTLEKITRKSNPVNILKTCGILYTRSTVDPQSRRRLILYRVDMDRFMEVMNEASNEYSDKVEAMAAKKKEFRESNHSAKLEWERINGPVRKNLADNFTEVDHKNAFSENLEMLKNTKSEDNAVGESTHRQKHFNSLASENPHEYEKHPTRQVQKLTNVSGKLKENTDKNKGRLPTRQVQKLPTRQVITTNNNNYINTNPSGTNLAGITNMQNVKRTNPSGTNPKTPLIPLSSTPPHTSLLKSLYNESPNKRIESSSEEYGKDMEDIFYSMMIRSYCPALVNILSDFTSDDINEKIDHYTFHSLLIEISGLPSNYDISKKDIEFMDRIYDSAKKHPEVISKKILKNVAMMHCNNRKHAFGQLFVGISKI